MLTIFSPEFHKYSYLGFGAKLASPHPSWWVCSGPDVGQPQREDLSSADKFLREPNHGPHNSHGSTWGQGQLFHLFRPSACCSSRGFSQALWVAKWTSLTCRLLWAGDTSRTGHRLLWVPIPSPNPQWWPGNPLKGLKCKWPWGMELLDLSSWFRPLEMGTSHPTTSWL